MLISNSNNFVFIRTPKTGSTSALFYFLNSGLYDEGRDSVELDGGFNSWEKMQEFFLDHPEDYLERYNQQRKRAPIFRRTVHATYSELIQRNRIKEGMPCFSVIRNPIDRLCSIYFYNQKIQDELGMAKNKEGVNEFCYSACIKGEPLFPGHAKSLQSSYFPEHANLWNTENLHEHATSDITALGGKVDNKIYVRKTSQKPVEYQGLLSAEVVQMIELKYAQDFVLWEKAYAVYN